MANRGVNKVILVGYLGQDPEIKYTASGAAIANLSIATSESWKDAGGAKQEKTEWHRIVAFRKLADIIGQYVKKGQQIYIEGKIQTRKWQDKDGNDRYSTEIIADTMQMLGGREVQPRPETKSTVSYVERPSAQPVDAVEAWIDHGYDDELPF